MQREVAKEKKRKIEGHGGMKGKVLEKNYFATLGHWRA